MVLFELACVRLHCAFKYHKIDMLRHDNDETIMLAGT